MSDVVRCAPAATRGAVHPLLNSRYVERMPLYTTTASQRWRSAATSRFIRASSTPRCRESASALRKRRSSGKQAWRGPGSSEGAGGPSTPFSSRLPHSKPNARGASTPTNPRASDRTSYDNKSQALPKRQSQDVADSSGRHETQVRGDDVHTREHTSPAGIGLAAEPGGWPAGGGGRARQDKLVQTVLSEHTDRRTLEHAMDLEDSLTSQPFRGRTAQPTIAKMSGQREQATTRRGRLGFHASRTAPAMRRQDSPALRAASFLKRKENRRNGCCIWDAYLPVRIL